MDAGNEWTDYLASLLPADYQNFVVTHILQSNTPFQIAKNKAAVYAQQAFDAMYPLVEPMVSRFLEAIYNSPDVVFIAFVLALLYMAIRVLGWMRRVVVFWTRMVFRAALLAVLFGLLSMAWQRGPEQTIRDLVVVCGKASGYAAWAKDFWLQEYANYQAGAAGGKAYRGAPTSGRRAY